MDTVSLLGPPPSKQPLTQDEFDARYNFKKSGAPLILEPEGVTPVPQRSTYVTAKTQAFQWCPFLQFTGRYNIKRDLAQDILGSFLLAALFLPQSLIAGFWAMNNVFFGIYATLIPQLLYIFTGSSRHSSIGALSFVPLMISSSHHYSQSDIAIITILCAFTHLLLCFPPFEAIALLLPDFMLAGVFLGMFARVCLSQASEIVVFMHPNCTIGDWCAKIGWECISSVCPWTMMICIGCVAFCVVFMYFGNPWILERFSFTIPFELLVIVTCTTMSYLADFENKNISTLSSTELDKKISLRFPKIHETSIATFWDAISIALFIFATHLKTTKTIAMEKMLNVDRKKEAVSFALFETVQAFCGFPPTTSSIGLSQINLEASRFSLAANVFSFVWIVTFIAFGSQFTHYVPTVCLRAIIVATFFPITHEVLQLRRLYQISKHDAISFVISSVTIILVPNVCKGFFMAIIFNIFLAAQHILRPTMSSLSRIDAEGRFAEEVRYDGEFCDAPARIVRFNAPLLFANIDMFRENLLSQAKLIKGQVPLGIGTRTGSLRSQVEVRLSAPLEARLSLVQSRTNLTNFVINDTTNAPTTEQSLIRCLIVDFCATPAVDSHGMKMIAQVYFELNNEGVKMMFANVNACVRDAMNIAGIFTQLPRNAFFPTLNDAVLASKALIMPIHTSVSLNGCRDVIAVSACGSHFDVTQIGSRDNDSKGEPV